MISAVPSISDAHVASVCQTLYSNGKCTSCRVKCQFEFKINDVIQKVLNQSGFMIHQLYV